MKLSVAILMLFLCQTAFSEDNDLFIRPVLNADYSSCNSKIFGKRECRANIFDNHVRSVKYFLEEYSIYMSNLCAPLKEFRIEPNISTVQFDADKTRKLLVKAKGKNLSVADLKNVYFASVKKCNEMNGILDQYTSLYGGISVPTSDFLIRQKNEELAKNNSEKIIDIQKTVNTEAQQCGGMNIISMMMCLSERHSGNKYPTYGSSSQVVKKSTGNSGNGNSSLISAPAESKAAPSAQ